MFGLRSEWLALYLREPQDWPRSGGLGVRQVQSLRVWLRTTGLVDRRAHETRLCHLLRRTWPESLLAWQLLWANVVFGFPTASWYVIRVGLGEWTTNELRRRLQEAIPRLAARTQIGPSLATPLTPLLLRPLRLGQGHVGGRRVEGLSPQWLLNIRDAGTQNGSLERVFPMH